MKSTMNKNPGIANKGLTMLIGTISTAAMNLLQGIILSRILGPAGTGQYQLAVTMSVTLTTFFAFGLGLANIFFLNHHKIDPRRIVMNSLSAGLFLGVISSLTMFYFFTFNKHYVGAFDLWPRIIISVGMCFMMLHLMTMQILIALMKVREYVVMTIVSSFASLFLLTVCGGLGILTPGISLIIYALYQFTMTFISLYFLRAYISFSFAPDLKLMWRTFKYGLQMYSVNLLLTLDQNISLIAIGYLMPGRFEAAGYYSRAITLCGLMRLIPTALTNLLYSHWALVDGQERIRQVEKVIRLYLIFGLAILFVIIFAGRYLIELLYGHAFLPALLPLQILGVQQTMWMISKVFQALFAGSGKPLLTTLNIGGGNVISVAGAFVLIPMLGIVGAAVALTAGQAVYTFLNVMQAKKYFGLRFMNCLSISRADFVYLLNTLRRRRPAR